MLLLITTQAVLSDRHSFGRAHAFLESNAVASLCAALSPLAVGGFERAGLGWRAGLLVPLVALPWLVLFFRAAPLGADLSDHQAPAESQGTGALGRRFWAYAVVLFLSVAVEFTVILWAASFLIDAAGMEPSSAATALGAFLAAMLLGRLVGSRIARRRGILALLFGALVLALAGFLLFWLPASPGLSVVGLFACGLGVANLYPLSVAAATGEAPQGTGKATARLALAGGLSVLLAPLALGVLADATGIRAAYAVVVPVLLAAMAVVARLGVGARAATPGRRGFISIPRR